MSLISIFRKILFSIILLVGFNGHSTSELIEVSKDSMAKEIPGFPVAQRRYQRLLFDGRYSEKMNFIDVPLLRSRERANFSQNKDIVTLYEEQYEIEIGYRFVQHEAVDSSSTISGKENHKAIVVLLGGGPARVVDYMKKRATVFLELGYDVVLPEQRGARDNKISSPEDMKLGASIPLDETNEGANPRVVATIANFSEVASDVGMIINQVRSDYPHQKIILVGHSAGGEIINHFLGQLSEEPSQVIPDTIIYSGSSLPGVQISSRWIGGGLLEDENFRNFYESNLELRDMLHELFSKIETSDSALTSLEKNAARSHIFNALSTSIVAGEDGVESLIESVRNLDQTLQTNGIRQFVRDSAESNSYVRNKLYHTLVPITIGGGLTDLQAYNKLNALLGELGVNLFQPPISQIMPSFINAMTVYEWGDPNLPYHFAYFYQELPQIYEDKEAIKMFTEPPSQDILNGLKKVPQILFFNGEQDPISNGRFMVGGVLKFFESYNFDPGQNIVFMNPVDAGHGALFSGEFPNMVDEFITEGKMPEIDNTLIFPYMNLKNRSFAIQWYESSLL